MAARPARGRSDGSPHRRVGRWRGRAGRGRHRARSTRRRRTSRSDPPAWTGSLGHDARDRTSSATCWPGSASRPRRPVPGRGSSSRPARSRSTSPAGDDEVIDATVPTWRRDLAVEADITEEIARVRGYELVPATLPDTPMPPYRPDPLAIRTMLRETLAGAGLSEAVTYALVAPAPVERFPAHDDGRARRRARAAPRPAVRSSSPIRCRASTRSCARASIGSLLEVVSTNLRHGRDDVAIFEVGKGYGAPDDGRPTNGGGSASR